MKFFTIIVTIACVLFSACEPETVVLGYGTGGSGGDPGGDAGPLDLDGAPFSDATIDAEPK